MSASVAPSFGDASGSLVSPDLFSSFEGLEQDTDWHDYRYVHQKSSGPVFTVEPLQHQLPSCSIEVQNVFGPLVARSCQRGFDLTLLFEETMLRILPLAIAMLWASVRLPTLWKNTVKARTSWLFRCKVLMFATYILIQFVLLGLWNHPDIQRTRATLASTALTTIGFIFLLYISYLEHIKSVRPSTLLSLFLGLSATFDLAHVRTLIFIAGQDMITKEEITAKEAIVIVSLAAFAVKCALFILELTEKRHLLLSHLQDVSSEAASSIFNRALFLWLNKLMFTGYQSILTLKNVPAVDEEVLASSKPLALNEKWRKADKSSKDALFWTFVKHYKWSLFAGVLPRLAYSTLIFLQPVMVRRVLDFTKLPPGPDTASMASWLTAGYAVVYIGIGISYSVYEHKTYRVLTMFRGSLVTFIFDKTLRISSSAISDAEAITLMSADIDRIRLSMQVLHEFYASFLELGFALWLLYDLLGVATIGPAVYILVCLAGSFPLATAAGDAQTPWLEAIEDRLAVTAKALGAMKPIKLTGLANSVSSIISDLRTSEIAASRRYRILDILVTMTFHASSAFAPVWGFGVYIILAKINGTETLTESRAFAALSLFGLIDNPIICITDGLEQIQTLLNSFRRIQEYLLSDEREDYRITPTNKVSSRQPYSDQLSEKTDSTGFEYVETFPSGSFGGAYPDPLPVAVSVKNAMAGYDPDQPILTDVNVDIARNQITMIIGPVGSGKSTLLRLLLGELPYTSGSVSTTFSKAAFCPQTPWLTWGSVQKNILGMSMWDQPWYKTVVNACALSTDFLELPDGDQTSTGTRGSRLSGGQQMRVSLARALYSRNPVLILDDVLTGLDRSTERSVLEAVFGDEGLLRKQLQATVILATNSVPHLHYADQVIVLNEQGQIAHQGTLETLSTKSDYFKQLAGQPPALTARPELELKDETLHELGLAEDQEETDADRKSGDAGVYLCYMKTAGWMNVACYLVACMAFIGGISLPSIWLQKWTNANAMHPNENISYWLGVYAGLAGSTLIGCFVADWMLNLIVVPQTSLRFHDLLLSTTMRATTAMLTTTDAGKTTNRFGQDLDLLDNELPKALDRTVFHLLTVIVSGVLIFLGSSYAAIAVPLCLLFLYLIQTFYLRTSRQLRLLEMEAKAPLFSQFLETLGGISCIRAYDWSDEYAAQNHDILNASQRPYYLLWCIQRWLILVLDLFVAGLAILVVALATHAHGTKTGFLGVALFNIVSFSTNLQSLVTQWTQLETAVGALTRIKSYVTQTPCEDDDTETGLVDPSWPSDGALTFSNVVASYDAESGPMLKNISLSIQPGEKVAICGRSGSGKSSLISALLRMLELDQGSISIDGIDTTSLPRHAIRERLNTLPQEPFFLHGTVRANIDPLHRTAANDSDTRIQNALSAVGLWHLIASRGGLDQPLDDEALSHGQRQLFCLARAMIKGGTILVLDEATSSVDADTDRLMQRVIREAFRACTIVAVAHKLDTVLDFDRVVLLDRGCVVEMGRPGELLAREGSLFGRLYQSLQMEGV